MVVALVLSLIVLPTLASLALRRGAEVLPERPPKTVDLAENACVGWPVSFASTYSKRAGDLVGLKQIAGPWSSWNPKKVGILETTVPDCLGKSGKVLAAFGT